MIRFALMLSLAMLAAACATPLPPPVIDTALFTVDGVRLDPNREIDPILLHDALASYQSHYGTVEKETREFVFPEKTVESTLHPIRRDVLGIVDLRVPANRPRFFLIDIASGSVQAFRVAHGRNSDPAGYQQVVTALTMPGPLKTTAGAVAASNQLDSNMSAVGAYVAANSYDDGRWPGSVRLHGLDATNSCVFWRAIVLHQAHYMTPDPVTGQVGTSDGCLAVEQVSRPTIGGLIEDGGFLYIGPVALHQAGPADGLNSQAACESVRLRPELGPQTPPPGL